MSDLQERVKQLLVYLEHMRKRPGMYGLDNIEPLETLLRGLVIGCSLAGVDIDLSNHDKIFFQVLKEYGWHFTSMSEGYQMKAQGYSIEKIIDEMLLIRIETLKRRYNVTSAEEQQD